MWISYYIFLCFMIHQAINSQTKVNRRQRRYLIFTPSTQWGVFATVSVPLHPESTVSVAWFFEANYYIVDNATYYDPLLGDIDTVSRSREGRALQESKPVLTRSVLYSFIESMLEKHNFPGHPCLLRAICESASRHFLHNGVLGDIIHLTLTPSTSISEDGVDDSYYEAEYYGLEDQCETYVDECPTNPLEYISACIEDAL